MFAGHDVVEGGEGEGIVVHRWEEVVARDFVMGMWLLFFRSWWNNPDSVRVIRKNSLGGSWAKRFLV